MKRALPVLLLASLCVSTALATTYVRVEKDGTKTYSDRPIPGGQAIDLEPAQGYSAPSTSGNSSLSLRPQQEIDDFRYQSCAVTPQNDATFTNPETVAISVVTSPALRPFDTLTMTVDGQAIGQQGGNSFTMTQVPRGSHTVVATIKSQDGRVVCTATSVFHVMRPSLNSPGRR